jgi:uncharacterized SAM-binding protein YcdF (DUF218 family)
MIRLWRLSIFSTLKAVTLVVVLLWAGLNAADSLLVIRQEPCKADVIVVLGGETKIRAAKVIELYRQGYAPRILVTGRNEETLIVQYLTANGVPEYAILREPFATSTYENAVFTIPMLQRLNAKKVLLVTSWYHSRRALKIFQGISETVEFIATPTDCVAVSNILRDKRLRNIVLWEYVKNAGYWLKYGIFPFHNHVDEK